MDVECTTFCDIVIQTVYDIDDGEFSHLGGDLLSRTGSPDHSEAITICNGPCSLAAKFEGNSESLAASSVDALYLGTLQFRKCRSSPPYSQMRPARLNSI